MIVLGLLRANLPKRKLLVSMKFQEIKVLLIKSLIVSLKLARHVVFRLLSVIPSLVGKNLSQKRTNVKSA